jgi:hypothetical protein
MLILQQWSKMRNIFSSDWPSLPSADGKAKDSQPSRPDTKWPPSCCSGPWHHGRAPSAKAGSLLFVQQGAHIDPKASKRHRTSPCNSYRRCSRCSWQMLTDPLTDVDGLSKLDVVEGRSHHLWYLCYESKGLILLLISNMTHHRKLVNTAHSGLEPIKLTKGCKYSQGTTLSQCSKIFHVISRPCHSMPLFSEDMSSPVPVIQLSPIESVPTPDCLATKSRDQKVFLKVCKGNNVE